MFRFVTSEEALTSDLEEQITGASAWVQVTPTRTRKPAENAGALVLGSFSELAKKINVLEQQLKAEAKNREESDLVLAANISEIKNLMREKGIIEKERERIDYAHTLIHNCIVCFDRHRTMRLVPCGHMVPTPSFSCRALCAECAEKIINANGACPLCRMGVIKVERTFLS